MEARKDGAGILTPEQLEEAVEMYMAAHQADFPVIGTLSDKAEWNRVLIRRLCCPLGQRRHLF